ncbi:MAG: hypothetical protein CMO55_11450 [Verrucomicrobiales bacterium]|nr:hypothetical protein [Verrucomicrobiales bacterium]
MPKRHRSHQIEDESKTFFRSVIPESWVFRELSHDYGVDGEIECFSSDGGSTGLKAMFQIKGTGSAAKRTQCSMSFRVDTLEYWRSMETPVILVRYCSVGKQIYWSWFFDRRIRISKNGKNASIKFGEEDLWNEETPLLIFERLRALRLLWSQNVQPPVSVRFSQRKSLEETKLRQELRREMREFRSMVRFEDQREDVFSIELRLEGENLLVDLQGIATALMPIRTNRSELLASNIVIGSAVCLASVRQTHVSLKLLKAAYLRGDYHSMGDAVFILSRLLVENRDFGFLRQLVGDLQKRRLSNFAEEA